MTVNRSSDKGSPLLFRLQEESIGVNVCSAQISADMRRQEQLHLYLINISEEELHLFGESGFYIELNVTIGAGSNHMFTPEDSAGWGIIESTDCFEFKGWGTHPLKKNGLRCILELRADKTVQLMPGASLCFHWKRIVSTAPEGYTAIWANIFGFDGQGSWKISQSDYLFKKEMIPRIVYFSASPSCGAPGQRITLKWSVENAVKGMLLPEGYDIMGEVPQQSGSRVVTLGEEIDRYYLNLGGGGIGVFRETNVFLTPPVISELYIDAHKNLCWETHFALRLLLAKQGEDADAQRALQGEKVQYKEVCESGIQPLQDGTTKVLLRCEGLYQVERHLAVTPVSDNVTIYAEYLTYRKHRLVRLLWKTTGIKEMIVAAGDGDSYTLSTELNGTWEQIYPLTAYVNFIFCYSTADGREIQVQFEKEGTIG